jgi:protein SCO1/2
MWLDQDANKRVLSSFSGKKQIISLIYTHSLHTCPTIVSSMQAIENKLSEKGKQDVGFILVSLTPDTDTPAVLGVLCPSPITRICTKQKTKLK